MEKDILFPFYCDSAVLTITSSDMTTFCKNITFSGDSVEEYISGIPCGNDREITVTVFDPTKTRWCMGKDTVDVTSSTTRLLIMKLKQVQPNIISNDTIPGHRLKADEIWRGECFLRGDIEIPEDIRLTIEPGSTIRITSGQPDWDSLYLAKNIVEIHCNGSLLANGNMENIISLVPENFSSETFVWRGIGCSGQYASITYCHISHAEDGIFIYTNHGMANCKNCLISHSSAGIVDFGPENSFSNLTFYDVRYSFMIYNDNKMVDISLCDFSKTSLVDVFGTDSNQTIMVRNCNFYSKEHCNVRIRDGSILTAVNCYNIDQVKADSTGVINIINQASIPLSDAGCGFPVPFSDSTQLSKKKNVTDPEKQITIKEKRDREMVFKMNQIQRSE